MSGLSFSHMKCLWETDFGGEIGNIFMIAARNSGFCFQSKCLKGSSMHSQNQFIARAEEDTYMSGSAAGMISPVWRGQSGRFWWLSSAACLDDSFVWSSSDLICFATLSKPVHRLG